MAAAGNGDMNSISLVAIGIVVMLLAGVAGADNPCYGICWRGCLARGFCSWSPVCVGGCTLSCALGDTCGDPDSVVLKNTGERQQTNEDANHYCKLGCESSVCSVISAALHLDSHAEYVGEEAVKQSVERCNHACSGLCVKRFGAAVATP